MTAIQKNSKPSRTTSSEKVFQVSDRNKLKSQDDSEETRDFIREGQTQATNAYSAPDMSVDAVVLRDDPPRQNVFKKRKTSFYAIQIYV